MVWMDIEQTHSDRLAYGHNCHSYLMPFLDTPTGRRYLQDGPIPEQLIRFSPFHEVIDESTTIAAATAIFMLDSVDLPTVRPRAGATFKLPPVLNTERVNDFAKAMMRILEEDPSPFDSHAPDTTEIEAPWIGDETRTQPAPRVCAAPANSERTRTPECSSAWHATYS